MSIVRLSSLYAALLLASAARAGEPEKSACPAPGKAAPPFSFPVPAGAPGERASLSALKAKKRPAVVAFWAWSCAPCILEMPALQKLAAEWGEKTSVLLVHVGEDEARMKDALEKWSIKLPSALDESAKKSREAYCVSGLPRVFVLDEKGTVRAALGSLGEKLEATLRAEVEKARK